MMLLLMMSWISNCKGPDRLKRRRRRRHHFQCKRMILISIHLWKHTIQRLQQCYREVSNTKMWAVLLLKKFCRNVERLMMGFDGSKKPHKVKNNNGGRLLLLSRWRFSNFADSFADSSALAVRRRAYSMKFFQPPIIGKESILKGQYIRWHSMLKFIVNWYVYLLSLKHIK
jgi:hypothetical protein